MYNDVTEISSRGFNYLTWNVFMLTEDEPYRMFSQKLEAHFNWSLATSSGIQYGAGAGKILGRIESHREELHDV